MSSKQWDAALQVVNALEQNGYEAVIVGGAVRDKLLNRASNDVDVATEAIPEQVKQVFKNTVDVGIEHGTILVVDCKPPVEVTTYRTESTYSDRRRPDQVQFVRSLAEDLKRRDFTINAMAMKANNEVVDLYGGREDLEASLIRAVGDASERFSEDALRMLRAARFRAQLGFVIEEKTLRAMQDKADYIQDIAMERVAQELEKIFASSFPALGIEAIAESDLESYLDGDFNAEDWHAVHNSSALQGWAYFHYLNPEAQILTRYKCSNKVKLFANRVGQLIEVPNANWDALTLFNYGQDELLAANAIRKWQGETSHAESTIIKAKNELVIQTMQDMAASGKELLEWNPIKRGPWVKEHLEQLKIAILTREVENEKSAIKEWYDALLHKG